MKIIFLIMLVGAILVLSALDTAGKKPLAGGTPKPA